METMNYGIKILLNQHNYIRSRLLILIEDIYKYPNPEELLYWNLPFGENGRAHIVWQILHCAATLDKYLNVRILNQKAKDHKLLDLYGSGSKPDNSIKHEKQFILETLKSTKEDYQNYMLNLSDDLLNKNLNNNFDRTLQEILNLLNWHEAEHTGQCQTIVNSYKALYFLRQQAK